MTDGMDYSPRSIGGIIVPAGLMWCGVSASWMLLPLSPPRLSSWASSRSRVVWPIRARVAYAGARHLGRARASREETHAHNLCLAGLSFSSQESTPMPDMRLQASPLGPINTINSLRHFVSVHI